VSGISDAALPKLPDPPETGRLLGLIISQMLRAWKHTPMRSTCAVKGKIANVRPFETVDV